MKVTTVYRLASLVMLISLVTIGTAPMSMEGQAQVAPPQLNPTKLYMMEGMTLEPLKSTLVDEFQAVMIPDGFVRDGLRGFGIIPLGHTYWKPVGTWYGQPVRQKINLGGQLVVGVWCTNTERTVTSDFIFELRRDDTVMIQASVNGARINAGQDTLVIARASFPPGNDTTVTPGSVLSLFIQARCNGGATLKFGSSSLDSGFNFDSNALSIHDVRATRHNVILEYKDAFLAPWTKIYTQVIVDRLLIPNDRLTSLSNSLNLSREIYWDRENRIGQDLEVFVTIGYSPELNISTTRVLKVQHKVVPTDLGDIFSFVFRTVLFITVLVVGAFLISTLNKRMWRKRFRRLPEDKKAGSYKEKKAAWRAMMRAKRAARKDRVRSRKVERTPAESEGFGFFKKNRGNQLPKKAQKMEKPIQNELEL